MLTEGSQASICSPESGFQLLFASSRKAELYYMGSDGRQTQPGLGGGRARASPQVMPPWRSPARAWRWFSLEGLKRKRLFLLKKNKFSNSSGYSVGEGNFFQIAVCTRSAPSITQMLPEGFYFSHQLCGQGAGLAGPFPIPALPSSRDGIQWGHHYLCGGRRIKANGSNCRNEEPQPSVGIGVWGSPGAELRFLGGKPEPGSTRDTGAGSGPSSWTTAVL